jgi:hypothetical protein
VPVLNVVPNLEQNPRRIDPERVLDIQTPVTIGGLPAGMVGGAPSVALIVDLPDGRVAFIQTSLKLLLTAADALKATYGDPR